MEKHVVQASNDANTARRMRATLKYKVALICLMFAIFRIAAAGAAEQPTIKDIGDMAEKFAADGVAAAGFAGHTGLNWSDMYIGQLIDIPPHWGIGLSLGVTSLSLKDHVQDLSNAILGVEQDDSFAGSLIMPGYALEFRIGGFRTIPFDIAIKWGWLPSLPLMKNDVENGRTLYGLDLRYAVTRGWGMMPAFMVGFEVDQVNGSISHKSPPNAFVRDAAGSDIIIEPGDSMTALTYEAWSFNAKAGVSKKFYPLGITVFADLMLGASIGKGGYKITGTDIALPNNPITSSAGFDNIGDMSDAELGLVGGYLGKEQGKGDFLVSENSISSQFDSFSLNINASAGVSYEFDNKTNLQLSILFDFVHFEYGAVLSFRYQQ